MYGFPTETEQETIDSLEIVRQLFQRNCIRIVLHTVYNNNTQSNSQNPQEFGIEITASF